MHTKAQTTDEWLDLISAEIDRQHRRGRAQAAESALELMRDGATLGEAVDAVMHGIRRPPEA